MASWKSMHLPKQEVQKMGFSPGAGKISWGRKWQHTAIFLSGESRRQRNSPWGCKESHTAEGRAWPSTAWCNLYAIYQTAAMCYAVLNRPVISGSFRHHGLYTTRFFCSWGFSRQGYWSQLPSPPTGDLPNPRIEPKSPTLQADSLQTKPPGKLSSSYSNSYIDII